MSSRAPTKSQYTGTWHITEMDCWDADYINLVVPGYIRIDRDGHGFMQFGAVEADLDCRVEDVADIERLEFTFQGFDEGDPISGRGWGTASGSEMTGRIFIHQGDESGFMAAKTSPAKLQSSSAPRVIRLPKRMPPAGHGLEARPYSAEVLFQQHRPPLAQFARDLNIVPELVPEIEEDSWGTRASLEIWFQEINGPKLTFSIQRAHFKRKETYVRDLESFLGDIETLTYVEQVQIERH